MVIIDRPEYWLTLATALYWYCERWLLSTIAIAENMKIYTTCEILAQYFQ